MRKIKQLNMDNLAKQITELNKQLASQVEPETLLAFQKSIEDLKEKQIENRSLHTGQKFPDFELQNFDHKIISLQNLVKGKSKVIIAFLRGSWCPYCNLELRALQNDLQNFEDKNAKLIVITPQPAETNLEWQKQHDIAFEIITDKDNQLAKKAGIDFDLQDFVIPHYEKLGIDLPKINLSSSHNLPIPAVFVVNSDSIITYKYVNSNYMERIDIEELLKHL